MEGSSAPSPDVPADGLRARKKVRTRRTISDVATALFVEHGFEQVSVAQVAEAADVSVKTVFNYFPTKEELFFDRADEVIGVLVDAVAERPPGETVVGALRAVLADRRVPFDRGGWRALRDPSGYERIRAFIATEHAAPALRARRLIIADQWVGVLAAALARELDLRAGDPSARTLAAMVLAVMALRERELSAALLERVAARTVERRVRALVDDACQRLARAFADVDRPRADV